MRPIHTLVVLCACACSAVAQEPKKQPKPADKGEPVAGRKTKKIEGVTFLISAEALKADASKFTVAPLDALERECKQLTARLSPKSLEMLRRMTIFVDWDDVGLENSREKNPIASYYGGAAGPFARDGLHALQARSITIHSLKKLTETHQYQDPKRPYCVLLHEFAHAVHDQVIGKDHAGVKVAYEQAMERRLVDRESYAATNHAEFFAEMSCAYVDRLHYYPHNRADLKKHDPVTFKTLEGVWAALKADPKDAEEKPDLGLSFPADVKFGPALVGPEPETDKLAGKFVLIGGWGVSGLSVIDRLEAVRGDLEGHGVVVFAASGEAQEDDILRARTVARAPHLPAVRNAFLGSGISVALVPGEVLLFDRAGKCVYRGHAPGAEEVVRVAVGKGLLTAVFGPGEVPAAFQPVADALAAGAAPASVTAKLAPLTTSAVADTKERALKLQGLILAPGEKALADAQAKAKADPLEAFVVAEQVAARFKGTPLATKAGALQTTLRTRPAVAAELKARPPAAEIEKAALKLRIQYGNADPTDAAAYARYKKGLTQLNAQLDQLFKAHPDARATAAVDRLVRELGLK